MAKYLSIIDSAGRGAIEEQDDRAAWFTHAMKNGGADVSILLRSDAVNHARGRPPSRDQDGHDRDRGCDGRLGSGGRPARGARREQQLRKTNKVRDFKRAVGFVDRIGGVAEEQGHHPDLRLAWGRVVVEIWTHKIDGLTESDFIFAAKCDRLFAA